MKRRTLRVAQVLSMVVTAQICGIPTSWSTPPSNDRHEAGRAIYNFRCYYCHGYSGDAKTLAATFLVPKPRDFTGVTPDSSLFPRYRDVVANGIAGTAMKPFAQILSTDEIGLVTAFILEEFVTHQRVNTRYHTEQNGWPDHERYSAAYPFALGQIALDTPWESLPLEQQSGKKLYLESCVSCHDRAKVTTEGPIWDLRPLSFPRNEYSHRETPTDAMTEASTYALHDIPPKIAGAPDPVLAGERLFQDNCAFCHGADGTGRNWIGSFLEPHPRDLTDLEVMRFIDQTRIRQSIMNGLVGTSMPAWKEVLNDTQIDQVVAYIEYAFTKRSRLPE